MLSNVEILLTLDGPIEACMDGQEGFQTASEGVTDSDLKRIFLDYSFQRSQFANELQILVYQVGETSELLPVTGPAPHRGWNSLEAAVTGGNEQEVLDACLWGEHAVANTFLDALHRGLQDPLYCGPIHSDSLTG
jgi:uncharacterized protein (TIGR02284 family)